MPTNVLALKRDCTAEAVAWLAKNLLESAVTGIWIFQCNKQAVQQVLKQVKNQNQNKCREINPCKGHNKVLTAA